MKYALVENTRTEPAKGAAGRCPACGSEVIARCGDVRVHHWAHKGNRNCDFWWESETPWHREWKGQFPSTWQEVVHHDNASGEKHIADVKTAEDWVIEFQHSYLQPEERRAREAFYPKLVWIVDGLRRKRDVAQFETALNDNALLCTNPLILRVHYPKECRLLVEWQYGKVPVFFDFHDPSDSADTWLWLLFPGELTKGTYIARISRKDFIQMHSDSSFEMIINKRILPISRKLANRELDLQKAEGQKQRVLMNRYYARRRRPRNRRF